MQGLACIFIAQIYGVDLELTNFLTIIMTVTLASVGTVEVAEVGLIRLSMVLTYVGLQLEGVCIIMVIILILYLIIDVKA